MVAAIRRAPWYTAFPDDYRWSFNVMIVLAMAGHGGAEPGEVELVVRRLRDAVGDDEAWFREWVRLADAVHERADEAEAAGHRASAAAHLRRACVYYLAAERFRLPKDEAAADAYRRCVRTFQRAAAIDHPALEVVEVPYEGTALPAYFTPAQGLAPGERAPAVVFFSGFDGNKEMNWFLGMEDLARRGISTLAVDSPGVGEALRFRGIHLRPDYEVAGGACWDHLAARADVDADRIGIMALSLGGYYASRTASRDHRFAACVAWGAIWDYHAVWKRRVDAAYAAQLPVPGDHLRWSTGTATNEEALAAIEGFRLDGVVQDMACPFLLCHGEDDQQVPVEDARRLVEAVGSADKTLRVFTGEEGGAQHCHVDALAVATPVIFDWLADRLGARPVV